MRIAAPEMEFIGVQYNKEHTHKKRQDLVMSSEQKNCYLTLLKRGGCFIHIAQLSSSANMEMIGIITDKIL